MLLVVRRGCREGYVRGVFLVRIEQCVVREHERWGFSCKRNVIKRACIVS